MSIYQSYFYSKVGQFLCHVSEVKSVHTEFYISLLIAESGLRARRVESCVRNESLFCRFNEEAQFKDQSGPSKAPFKGGLPQANPRTPRPSGIRNVHSDKQRKLGVLV